MQPSPDYFVTCSEWLDEECANLSREGVPSLAFEPRLGYILMLAAGLRTLVVGSRVLTEKQYETFAAALRHAKSTLHDRQANVQVYLQPTTPSLYDRNPKRNVQAVADTLEEDVALLGVTGVDDRLQVHHQHQVHRITSQTTPVLVKTLNPFHLVCRTA
jgi:hypothetical protein